MWDALVFIIVAAVGIAAAELVRAHCARMIATPRRASGRARSAQLGAAPQAATAES